MIITEHDKENKVVGFIYYNIVDKEGQLDDNGEYAYIFECWIHESVRGDGVLSKFARIGEQRHPSLKYVYYDREKYGRKIIIPLRRV
jgi:hypothetical protein